MKFFWMYQISFERPPLSQFKYHKPVVYIELNLTSPLYSFRICAFLNHWQLMYPLSLTLPMCFTAVLPLFIFAGGLNRATLKTQCPNKMPPLFRISFFTLHTSLHHLWNRCVHVFGGYIQHVLLEKLMLA